MPCPSPLPLTRKQRRHQRLDEEVMKFVDVANVAFAFHAGNPRSRSGQFTNEYLYTSSLSAYYITILCFRVTFIVIVSNRYHEIVILLLLSRDNNSQHHKCQD
jgi:hypothetical protein